MPKSRKRKNISERKKYKRAAAYKAGGGESNYARKRFYCIKNGAWGFEVPYPKPWRKSSWKSPNTYTP
jgi:hypothetical protein